MSWRLNGVGLLSSVRPCTLFPDIHPCMSGKDKFCAQNLLLINFPPILGRSDDKFFYRKTYYCLEPPPSVAVRGETAGKQNGGSFRTPASYAEHPHNVKMYRMVQCGFEKKVEL